LLDMIIRMTTETLEFPVTLSSGRYTGYATYRPLPGSLHGQEWIADCDCPDEDMIDADRATLRTEARRAVEDMDDARSRREELAVG
jgi:hypothetical protein